MAKIRVVACPHCRKVWRAPEGDTSMRCGACQKTFTPTESLYIDEETWDKVKAPSMMEALPENVDGKLPHDDEIRALAQNFSEFDARVPQPDTTDVPKKKGFRWGWLSFIFLLIMIPVGLALSHNPVLSHVPQLRSFYEGFCGHVHCPYFAWHTPGAITMTGTIERVTLLDDNRFEIVVGAELNNTSDYPQGFDGLEVRLMSKAGTLLGQRYLEPSEYVPVDAFLAPHSTEHLSMTFITALPEAPESVNFVMTPVVNR